MPRLLNDEYLHHAEDTTLVNKIQRYIYGVVVGSAADKYLLVYFHSNEKVASQPRNSEEIDSIGNGLDVDNYSEEINLCLRGLGADDKQ